MVMRVMLIPPKLPTLMLIAASIFNLIGGGHADLSTKECYIALNFTAVGLQSLPNGFVGNKLLTHLTLDENGISSVSSAKFSLVPRLSYLSLAKNKLTNLSLHPFSELQDLDTLILNGNCKARVTVRYVTESPRYYGYYDYHQRTTQRYEEYDYCDLQFDANLQSLTHLFVENNDLKKLSFISGQLPALTHLHLSHNPVEMKQETMSSLNTFAPALTHLYLRHCSLLEYDTLQLSNITSLYLDNNEIQSICSKYSCEDSSLKLNEARKLETLSASHNKISKIRVDSFTYTTQLLDLDLSHNKISEIPEGTFDKLYLLRSLSLEHNKLVQLGASNTFKDLIKLQTLSLGGNNISNISNGLFRNLSSLKQLMLNGTKISSIDSEMFSDLPSLEELSLADNQLTRIPEGALPTPGLLIALDLDKNKFKSTDDISLTDEPRMLSLSLKDNPLSRITAQWIASIRAENLTIIVG